MCGDSYELIKQIPSKSIDCIYTDVRYLYDRGGGGSSKLSQRITKMGNELLENDIASGFNYAILDEFVRVMKKVNIIIWFSKLQMQHILNYFLNLDKEIYFEPLFWGKTNPTPATNGTWLPDCEYAYHFREKGVLLNDGYELKSKFYISAINKKDKDEYEHPTIKPIEFVSKNIAHITKPNDIVFDPFIGSGTTAVACKQLGRRYIGFELSDKWHKVAVDRLNGINSEDRKKQDLGFLTIDDFLD